MSAKQAELWWADAEWGHRPVLVVTRDQAIPVLNRILVAPITRTVRRIPSELPLDHDEGLREESVASLDNLSLIPKSALLERIGTLAPQRRHELCAAVAAVADC